MLQAHDFDQLRIAESHPTEKLSPEIFPMGIDTLHVGRDEPGCEEREHGALKTDNEERGHGELKADKWHTEMIEMLTYAYDS